jgi:hypothetical protein
MATPPSSSLDELKTIKPEVDEPRAIKPKADFPTPPSNEDSASEKLPLTVEDFNPGWRFNLAFSSLAILTLMAALDATSLSVALPVSFLVHHEPQVSH